MSRPPPAVSLRTKTKALPATAGKSTKILNQSAREESESESEDERDSPTDTSSEESDDESDTSSAHESEKEMEKKAKKKENEKKEQPKKEKEKIHTPVIKNRSMPDSLESRSHAHQTNFAPPTFQDAKEKSTAKWNKSQKTQEEISSAV